MNTNVKIEFQKTLLIGMAEIARQEINASGFWLARIDVSRTSQRTWEYYSNRNVRDKFENYTSSLHSLGFSVLNDKNEDLHLSILWIMRPDQTGLVNVLAIHDLSKKFAHLMREDSLYTASFGLNSSLIGTLSLGDLTDCLSPTENRVFNLLYTPKTERDIAKELRRSPHTVHVHVKNIYRKLQVNSRKELISEYWKYASCTDSNTPDSDERMHTTSSTRKVS